MKINIVWIGMILFVLNGFFYSSLVQIHEVSVTPRNYNFVKVKLGKEKSTTISISTTGSSGGFEIEDYSFTPKSSPDFRITATPFSSTISPGRAAYIEITFRPTSPGLKIATLSINFRQGMEIFHIPVNFKGFGEGLTPHDRIVEILAFVDTSIQERALSGVGEGALAQRHQNDFKEQIRIAALFFKNGIKEEACRLFLDAIQKMDGKRSAENSPDYVQGEATSKLSKMISDLRRVLKCD